MGRHCWNKIIIIREIKWDMESINAILSNNKVIIKCHSGVQKHHFSKATWSPAAFDGQVGMSNVSTAAEEFTQAFLAMGSMGSMASGSSEPPGLKKQRNWKKCMHISWVSNKIHEVLGSELKYLKVSWPLWTHQVWLKTRGGTKTSDS